MSDEERAKPQFDHIQRTSTGERFLRITTDQTVFFVQVYRDDFEQLRDAINNPPTTI